jgi:hypothetical protein
LILCCGITLVMQTLHKEGMRIRERNHMQAPNQH